MSTMYKEVYEITGSAAKKKAEAFSARQQAARDAHWKIINDVGGEGYRPSYYGGIKSIMFAKDKVPPTFRRTGWDKGLAECVPLLKSKAGKELAERFKAAPKIEDFRSFADEFGWKGRSPMGTDGGRGCIYFATGVSVRHPRVRYFLQFPRTLKDGWKAPPGLKLVRESDMLRAIEDHNAAAKKAKK